MCVCMCLVVVVVVVQIDPSWCGLVWLLQLLRGQRTSSCRDCGAAAVSWAVYVCRGLGGDGNGVHAGMRRCARPNSAPAHVS